MKPLLNRTLLSVILAAATAHADYNGTAIVNEDAAHTGNIIITGNIDDDYTKDINHGAIELSGTEGSNKTITLEGNIAISAGADHAGDTDPYKTFGIYLGWAGEYVPEDESLNDQVSNAHVILKTTQASDSITIDAYSNRAYGIATYYEGNTITMDAASSAQPIRITTHGDSAVGIRARGGDINMVGNVVISSSAISAYVSDGAAIDVKGSIAATSRDQDAFNLNSASLKVTGDLDATGSASRGIYVNKGTNVEIGGATRVHAASTYGIDIRDLDESGVASSATFGGPVSITAEQAGIWTTLGGSAEIKGHLTVNVTGESTTYSAAVCAGSTAAGGIKSSVILNGATLNTVNRRALVTFGGTITANSALYRIDGDIYASIHGQIDLHTSGKSYINGATYFKISQTLVDSTGIINLNLQGESLWNVTDNSMLTNLTLGQGSALQLAFSGSSLTDIVSATDTITLENGSYIYLTGDLSGLKDDNTFDFFSGTLVNNGVKFVGFDGTDWLEYEYTQTGANTFQFSGTTQTLADEPGFMEAIPEPATATLGLLGLTSLLARRRKA